MGQQIAPTSMVPPNPSATGLTSRMSPFSSTCTHTNVSPFMTPSPSIVSSDSNSRDRYFRRWLIGLISVCARILGDQSYACTSTALLTSTLISLIVVLLRTSTVISLARDRSLPTGMLLVDREAPSFSRYMAIVAVVKSRRLRVVNTFTSSQQAGLTAAFCKARKQLGPERPLGFPIQIVCQTGTAGLSAPQVRN